MRMRTNVFASLIMAAVAAVIGALVWNGLGPGGQAVMQWGVDGEPSRLGSRFEASFALPLLMVGLIGLFMVLPKIDPRGRNLERSATPYTVAWLGTMALLLVVHSATAATALGVLDEASTLAPRLALVMTGVLLAAIGNVLAKARPNFFMGVRTPWTLSSDLAWDKTHRLAARLFLALGVACAVAGAFAPFTVAFVVILGGVLSLTLAVTVYSYFVWRSDPARVVGPQPVDDDA